MVNNSTEELFETGPQIEINAHNKQHKKVIDKGEALASTREGNQ